MQKISRMSKQRNTMYPKMKVREEKDQDGEHVAVGLQLLESLSLHPPPSPEAEQRDASPLLIARIPKSPLREVLAPTNYSHQEKEQRDASPLLIARIPKSPLRKVLAPTNYSNQEAEHNDKTFDEKEKPTTRETILTHESSLLTDAEKNSVEIDEKEKPNTRSTFLTHDFTSQTDAEKNGVEIDEKEKPNIRASSILRPRAVLSSPNNDAVMGNRSRWKAERRAALRNHDMAPPNTHAKSQCKASSTHIKCQVNKTFSNDVPDNNKSDLKGKKDSAMAVPGQRRHPTTWKF